MIANNRDLAAVYPVMDKVVDHVRDIVFRGVCPSVDMNLIECEVENRTLMRITTHVLAPVMQNIIESREDA